MNIDPISKRIGHKDWKEINDYWQHFLASINFPIDTFEANESLEDDLAIIASTIKKIELNSSTKDHYYSINGLQYRVFSESVALFYKAMNTMKAAQCDQLAGYKSWSIASYYQASYFSIKSILNILGVYSCRTNNNKWGMHIMTPDTGCCGFTAICAAIYCSWCRQVHTPLTILIC
ncbi:MAG: hypothetical protein HZA14_08380 [Nitrospirae bacterium]|nr:hypothetical protein [Nitrospirota bacterium]